MIKSTTTIHGTDPKVIKKQLPQSLGHLFNGRANNVIVMGKHDLKRSMGSRSLALNSGNYQIDIKISLNSQELD